MAFTRYAPITIDHSQCGSVNDFPMLFKGTYSCMRTIANGGYVTSTAGYDIAFSLDAKGTKLLTFTLNTYIPTTGEVYFWVRVPGLSNLFDTTIFAVFGDATITTDQSSATTWDTNYKAVYHLDGSPLSMLDATTNTITATNNNAVVSGTGEIAGAGLFNGSSNYLNCGSSTKFDFTTDLTLEAWVQHTGAFSTGTFPRIVSKFATTPYSGYELLMAPPDSGGPTLYMQVGDNGGNLHTASQSGTIANNTWYHIAGVKYFDGIGYSMNFYVNGTLNGTFGLFAGVIGTITNNLHIGHWPPGGGFWPGFIDEIRVSNSARSAGWISTCYNSQIATHTNTATVVGTATLTGTPVSASFSANLFINSDTGLPWHLISPNLSTSIEPERYYVSLTTAITSNGFGPLIALTNITGSNLRLDSNRGNFTPSDISSWIAGTPIYIIDRHPSGGAFYTVGACVAITAATPTTVGTYTASLLFLDSFDHWFNSTSTSQSNRKWNDASGNTIASPSGHGNALQFGDPGCKVTLPESPIYTVGARYQTSTFGNSILVFKNQFGTNANLSLEHNGTGGIYVQYGASTSTVISSFTQTLNSDNYFEMQGELVGGSVCKYEVHIDGTTTATGSLTASFERGAWAQLQVEGPGGGLTSIVEDLYVTNNKFLGPVKIVYRCAHATGDVTGGIVSAGTGTNWQMVSDGTIADDDTTTVDMTASGSYDLYYLDTITRTNSKAIVGIQLLDLNRHIGSTKALTNFSMKSNGTTTMYGLHPAIYNQYNYGRSPIRKSIFTNAGWGWDELNNMQQGFEKDS